MISNLITVITPNFNQSRYLVDNIKSIQSQQNVELEHIIVDGKSTDGFESILANYSFKNGTIISERDNGQSNAINKGIKIAKGTIINWLNADDYYEQDALQKVLKFFKDNNIKVIGGRSRVFNEQGTVALSKGTDIYQSNLAKTIGWARIDQPETFFRREAWEKVGLLNERLHYTMDREWWMRYLYIFGLNGIVKIQDILVNFRLHETSKTMSQKRMFQVEHDTLFYLMASAAKNDELCKLIADVCDIDYNIESEIIKWQDQNLIKRSLNYYLLKRTDEFYYSKEKSKSKALLKVINPDLLAREDRTLYGKLKRRLLIPSVIINLLRR